MHRNTVGRPPYAPERRRSVVVKVLFTEGERAELDKAADGNVSAWARDILLRAAKRSGEKGNRTQS